MSSITSLCVNALAKGIRSRQLKCVQIAQDYIANIESQKNLNAIIYFNKSQVLDEAHKLDKEADYGLFRGPLHGVPLVIKDNIHLKGIPNTAGSPALKNFVPQKDAPTAEKLRKAGALFIAKANMHELAFGVSTKNEAFGWARIPSNPDYSAGGSSGGTGSAIAASMAPAGLGSDTGGSVRIPSSVNGISGLRPTLGRYNDEFSVTPICHIRDTVGPMGRTVEDLIALDQVITSQPFDEKRLTSLKGVRLGVAPNYFSYDLHPDVAELFEDAKKTLSGLGAQLVEVDCESISKLNKECGFVMLYYGAKIDVPEYLRQNNINLTLEQLTGQIASPDVKKIYTEDILNCKISEADYKRAVNTTRVQLIQAYSSIFLKNNLNALVFPTLKCLPLCLREGKVDQFDVLEKTIANTDPGSNAGIPGLSIPMGRARTEKLPVGLEFDGLADDDQLLLAIGKLAQAHIH